MTVVLAIDQGTSGTKAVVIDDAGAVLGLSEVTVHPSYRAGGGVEQDPRELLDSVLQAGAAAVTQAGIPVDAVSLANQGETVLAWDPATGEALSPMIVWQDRRAQSVCDAVRDREPEIVSRTGLVLDPYFSAPKMSWLRQNLTRDGVVTTSDSWLVHQLTGEFVTDSSTASRSLVYDLDAGTWDDELLEVFGLGGERLPRIVASDAVVGETSAFGAHLPLAGLIVDQQAALAAEACLTAGDAKCTFGTGAFLLANTGSMATRSGSGLSSSVAWQSRGELTYCLDGQVYTAASAIRWLTELGLIGSAVELDAVAAADAGGALCVPALAGLGAPWWRPDAKASFTGMTLATGRGEFVRAVIEGIACQVAELAVCTSDDLGRPLARLRVDGGLTRSRVLMQAVADLTQLPVDVYPSQHATPLGGAAFARLALDDSLSLEDAVVAWRPAAAFEPVWTAERASEFSERWRAAAALS